MDFSSCPEEIYMSEEESGLGNNQSRLFPWGLEGMELASSSHHGFKEKHTFDKLAVRSKAASKNGYATDNVLSDHQGSAQASLWPGKQKIATYA